MQALVISRSTGGGRLLFADDVAGQRLVVSATLNPGTEDVIVQAWQGPAGGRPGIPAGGARAEPVRRRAARAPSPLAVPTSPGTLLLVLARPTVTGAEYSPTVFPDPRRHHRPQLGADEPDGRHRGRPAGTTRQGPALRVRCAGFDGPVAGSAQTWVGQGGTDGLAGYAEETRRFVAAALGQPADSLRTEVVTDAKVGGGVIDPNAISAQGGDGRVRVLRTTTADGGVVRSVRVVDDGRSQMNWLDLEPPSVLPADTPRDEPAVLRLDDARPGWAASSSSPPAPLGCSCWRPRPTRTRSRR